MLLLRLPSSVNPGPQPKCAAHGGLQASCQGCLKGALRWALKPFCRGERLGDRIGLPDTFAEHLVVHLVGIARVISNPSPVQESFLKGRTRKTPSESAILRIFDLTHEEHKARTFVYRFARCFPGHALSVWTNNMLLLLRIAVCFPCQNVHDASCVWIFFGGMRQLSVVIALTVQLIAIGFYHSNTWCFLHLHDEQEVVMMMMMMMRRGRRRMRMGMTMTIKMATKMHIKMKRKKKMMMKASIRSAF